MIRPSFNSARRSGAGSFRFALGASLTLAASMATVTAHATNCAQSQVDAYRSMIRPVPAEQMVRSHQPGDRMTPPADPGVGDSWLWYTWSLAGFPTATQRMCTVRGEGDNVYIVVEDSQWGTEVDQADVDRMLLHWDHESFGPTPTQGIFDINVFNFGPCPDELDNDPKVYVLYYDFDVSSDGFFWPFDQYPDGTQSFASNECEVLYMNSSDFDPGGDYLIGVQAHEFQHMIHWLADEDESSWINEGCSELAMWLFGKPDQVTAFPSNPDNNLTSWNANFADYVKVYLWTLYMYEQYGGRDSIINLVGQPGNSIAGVQAMLTARGYADSFAQITRDWVTANYLDDPTIGGGRYNYVGEDLPTFSSALKSAYPVPNTNATLNHWAGEYVRFINGVPQRLNFDGSDTSDWAVRVIPYLGGVPLGVEDMTLNGADAGFLDLPQFGTAYDQVVMVVANVSSSGTTSYSYSTVAEPAAIELPGAESEFSLRLVAANPIDGVARLALHLAAAGQVQVAVYGADGRRVRDLTNAQFPAGETQLFWDVTDDLGRAATPGAYFLEARTADGTARTAKLIVAR
ncbi:MAG: hypothetical protein IT349_05305 [Candidatus Eisenbacteria bacterium]|nr:hypothetical protein [Candidatus Eisenbacteria bacterium]